MSSASPFEGFLSTAEIAEVFGQEAFVQRMLDFEAALARAQGELGLIPAAAAAEITRHCDGQFFDAGAIVAASRTAGSLAIPLVKALTARVAEHDAEAGRYVHWGSTSQDVVDTAMALVTREALLLIVADLAALIASLRKLYAEHGEAPILARSLMQPAQVVSLGLKIAAWVLPMERARKRIAAAAEQALQIQFGGAVGTLAAMGEQGPAVAARVAEALSLRLPIGAWHTQRDEWLTLGMQVGILAGSLGKIARDWSLLSQGEIGELAEPSGGGRGGSSAMPHKRNPVSSLVALAAAGRVPHRIAALLAAMDQEQERGLGNWQAELAEWAGLFISTHGAVRALAEAAAGLTVDPARMRANIDRLQGLVFAEALSMRLAKSLGKARAHHLVEQWSQAALKDGRSLRDHADDTLSAAELDRLFDADAAAQPAIRAAALQLKEQDS